MISKSGESALSNAAQKASESYILPALDQQFMLSEPLRGVRFMLEYEKAQQALRANRVLSTLVVFGSSRVREGGPGRQAFWYDEARRFGRIASEQGGALNRGGEGLVNVVATGGGPGIMEAANRGAYDVGAPTIGFNITLPREQQPNPYTTPELTFRFHYFAMRKMHFAMAARALVVFPGGFGTFDEMFEVLTLVQTGKAPKIPIVLVDESYWRAMINFGALVDCGMVALGDLELFRFAADGASAWRELVNAGLIGEGSANEFLATNARD
jgi:uncharacterized protein (TIGR00730 family)